MATHKLKVWSDYFPDLKSGKKSFEVRKNDRGFKVGDTLELLEYDIEKKELTGNTLSVYVVYILEDEAGYFGIMKGYIIMSIKLLS